MRRYKVGIGLGALLVLGIGWYLFRPELLFIDQRVHEDLPAAEAVSAEARAKPQILAQGQFHGVSHDGKGTATIHPTGAGRRLLRFTDFETSNGPALRVYLIAADDAHDADAVRQTEIIDLGALKGNLGDQNYDIPAEVDLARYRAVTVWCHRFHVNFATAPLKIQATP